jgi:hypothetical protein
MAELLNKTFKAVLTREEAGNILELATKHVRSKLKTTSIRTKQAREKNYKSETDSAAGPDGIGPTLLEELADGLALALHSFFFLLAGLSVFPRGLERSKHHTNL